VTDSWKQSIQDQVKIINDLILQGNRSDAVQQATTLLNRGDRHPFVLSFLAHESLLQRDFPEAVLLSEEALQLSPDHLSLKRNLGIALLENGQNSRAIETFSRLINAGHEIPDLYYCLGSALRRSGEDYWSAVSFQKGVLIEQSEQRLGLATGTVPDQVLRHEGLQRVEAQLRRQLDQLIVRTERKTPNSITERVRRLSEHLCQDPSSLDALNLGRTASLLIFLETLDWAVPLSRTSFSWLIQLEHRFMDLIEQISELLLPDNRHHWVETEDQNGSDVVQCPLIVHGSKRRFNLPSVDALINQLQTILGQRISSLLPQVAIIRILPGTSLEQPLVNTPMMVSVVLPLFWPDGCQIGSDSQPYVQLVGRLIVPAGESLEIRNQSGRDAVCLFLNVAHPDVSDAERRALNAIVLELSSWLKLCESFSPSDLSLSCSAWLRACRRSHDLLRKT